MDKNRRLFHDGYFRILSNFDICYVCGLLYNANNEISLILHDYYSESERTIGLSLLILSHDLGIDLGTANTLVCLKGKGVVVSEPSVVAVNNENGDITAVGNDARNMIGGTPGNITVVRPMKDGVIADYDTTATMLKYYI